MSSKSILIFFTLLCMLYYVSSESYKQPSIMVVLLARNKEHSLPYFLTLFQQLEYPKNRMALYIRADHCEDKTIPILEKWLAVEGDKYHSVDVILDKNSTHYKGEKSRSDWNDISYEGIITLKEDALLAARKSWSDYVLYLDVDVYLTNANVIKNMLAKSKPVITTLLDSLGHYSNFWGEMGDDYWYVRSDDYIDILDGTKTGCFPVPMIYSFVLINLHTIKSDGLTFNPKNIPQDIPYDDIIAFAISAKNVGMEMTVCNEDVSGFLTSPVTANENILYEQLRLTSLRLDVMVTKDPLPVSPLLQEFLPPLPKKNKLDFDEIYLVNLLRRPERREKMIQNFDIIGLNVTAIDAVDGKKLTDAKLEEMNIQFLPGYKDPWHKRLMTFGEIGCFLSHYKVWKDVVEKGHESVLLFEDDIKFEPFFRENVYNLMHHINDIDLEWDLIYLGRKKLKNSVEPLVEDSEKLVHVDYSYWTLCYILSNRGAKKLLDAKPLQKLLPVDEFLPIMFNKHPETDWMEAFPDRTLLAFSITPLAVQPTHYTGDDGYISDTEDSSLIKDEVIDSNLYDSEWLSNDTMGEHELLEHCAKEGNCVGQQANLPSDHTLGQLNIPKDEL